ncbi:DUF5522 domain-containing protein [Sediminibacterium sp. C3]|uniref:DUF5522 domain-containing protein n=1 Tax=Sediminibacterium sp. C3 TaxID=1267211 RepID=UPI000405A71D|nr:DUF5522 domain-containing protein [Sediminibacterium sp. C3]
MSQQLIEGKDFYYDDKGYMVLTEAYHLQKGYCCGYGCRHCPFEYESVPEPRKSQLLQEKASSPNNA